jgi:Fe2+ or Zn2+ uptake regulation protein
VFRRRNSAAFRLQFAAARHVDQRREVLVDQVSVILARMRAAGGRVTVARRALVQALVVGEHLTADDLAAQVQALHPDVHLSTVYRTLDALEEMGIVTHVHLGHGRAVYHLAESAHLHLVCSRCGSVTELSDDVIAPLAEQVARENGFTLDPRHFALLGTCRACREGVAGKDPPIAGSAGAVNGA